MVASPALFPLSQVPAGDRAVMADFSEIERPTRQVLGALGIVPGVELAVLLTAPGLVVRVGDTVVALDRNLAGRILVRPKQ